MARAIYSLRIFSAGSLTSTAGLVGPIVPANLIYILRDVDVFDLSGAAGAAMLVMNPTSGFLTFFWGQKEPLTRSYAWRGRQVYNPGERVGFQVQAGTWAIMASGYQLTLP